MMTARQIADAILVNCAHHEVGDLTRDEWAAEQDRLWRLAAEGCVASEVMRLVAPSLMPPPYAVRKQLREATLKVGR